MTKNTDKPKITMQVDFKGMECSEMNFELRLSIKKIEIGDIIEVLTDNEEAEMKMPKWCLKNNQELFFSYTKNGLYYFYIKRTQ